MGVCRCLLISLGFQTSRSRPKWERSGEKLSIVNESVLLWLIIMLVAVNKIPVKKQLQTLFLTV